MLDNSNMLDICMLASFLLKQI